MHAARAEGARLVPGTEITAIETSGGRPAGIAGVCDVTDDWIPVYACTSLGGSYVAIGTSGNQFKNAPVIGQLMTALITECEAGRDQCHGLAGRHRGRPAKAGNRNGRSAAGAVPVLTNSAICAPVTAASVIPRVEWPVAT